MKGIIKGVFASVTTVLFAFAASAVLYGAYRTPGFEPNDAHTFLLNTVGAAIIAFITTQLGIMSNATGTTLRARAHEAMGFDRLSGSLLAINAGVFLLAGLGFVAFWVRPDFLAAVPASAAPLAAAPEYIATQAQAFVGVTLAALAGLAPGLAPGSLAPSRVP